MRLAVEDEELYSDTYRRKLAHNRKTTLTLIARVNNNLTEEQREYRREVFTNYIRDFQRLTSNN
jgi:hypothetical protein